MVAGGIVKEPSLLANKVYVYVIWKEEVRFPLTNDVDDDCDVYGPAT
jgi:hypothetical protein